MNYNKYNKTVKEYLEKIEAFLIKKYGNVSDEWEVILYLLADNIDLYLRCKHTLLSNGIFDASTYKKNPLLSTLKDLQATILKQVQHLGISPYAASKIKQENEDDSEDFISSLINE